MTVGGDVAAVHAFGVEGQRDVAVSVDGDDLTSYTLFPITRQG
jgi:hypothetical protein